MLFTLKAISVVSCAYNHIVKCASCPVCSWVPVQRKLTLSHIWHWHILFGYFPACLHFHCDVLPLWFFSQYCVFNWMGKQNFQVGCGYICWHCCIVVFVTRQTVSMVICKHIILLMQGSVFFDWRKKPNCSSDFTFWCVTVSDVLCFFHYRYMKKIHVVSCSFSVWFWVKSFVSLWKICVVLGFLFVCFFLFVFGFCFCFYFMRSTCCFRNFVLWLHGRYMSFSEVSFLT